MNETHTDRLTLTSIEHRANVINTRLIEYIDLLLLLFILYILTNFSIPEANAQL